MRYLDTHVKRFLTSTNVVSFFLSYYRYGIKREKRIGPLSVTFSVIGQWASLRPMLHRRLLCDGEFSFRD